MRRILLALLLPTLVREIEAQCHPERSVAPAQACCGAQGSRPLAALGMTRVGPIAPGAIQGSSIERYQLIGSLVVSYRVTRYGIRQPGFDLGVGIIPRALADGTLAATIDLGAAQATPLGGSLLFLRGGAGALLVTGQGLGGLVPALQAGLAMVIPLDPRTAVRFDLGEHLYLVDRTLEPRWSVGVGLAVLPP